MEHDYSTWSAEELLKEIEMAGRCPNLDLIHACLDRHESITPGLLGLLSEGGVRQWDMSDPRWYRGIHAALLLIEIGEEAALPIFDEILRDPEREPVLVEWFETWLPEYGPSLTPILINLARDDEAWQGGRMAAIGMLAIIVHLYPEEREQVLVALRALLPVMQEDGTLLLPCDPFEACYDEIEIWTWAVGSLMDLHDHESSPHVEVLFKEGLLDEDILGDIDIYIETLKTPPEQYDTVTLKENVTEFYGALCRWGHMNEKEVEEALQMICCSGKQPYV